MFIATKEVEFDAAHRVPLHESKCRNLHGHRYRVVAHIAVDELISEGSETGMVRDFGIIKEYLMDYVHDIYDHGTIVYDDDKELIDMLFECRDDYMYPKHGWNVTLVDFVPTAENLAKHFYETLKKNGLDDLVRIDVWETPTGCASYMEEKVN